jgi:hypothetical protein
MNIKNKHILVSFAAGVILASVAVYLILRPSLPSVQALRCEVQPNEFISISGFGVKVFDTDKKLPKPESGNARQPRIASLQWRCNVKNISTVPVRYRVAAELLDRDGFVLATDVIDSHYDQGDLSPGQTHRVHNDIVMEYSRLRILASSRVTPVALKTDAQIEQERAQTEQKRKEERAQEQQAHQAARDERGKRINAVRKAWKGLRQGMTKAEVQSALGKPRSIESFGSAGDWWEYPSIEGSYETPKVDFSSDGRVVGWTGP